MAVSAGLLEAFDLADKYAVVQADTLELRCRDCGETVYADCVDIHEQKDCGE